MGQVSPRDAWLARPTIASAHNKNDAFYRKGSAQLFLKSLIGVFRNETNEHRCEESKSDNHS